MLRDPAGRRYRVVLSPELDEDGGGWIAEIPEFPGAMGAGDTIEEALQELEESKESLIGAAMEDGEDIPEAIPADYEYSGKFTLRIPRSLHRQLAMQAEAEGTSLNQYCQYLLSSRVPKKTDISPEWSSRLRSLLSRRFRVHLAASLNLSDLQNWDESEFTEEQGGEYVDGREVERLVTKKYRV